MQNKTEKEKPSWNFLWKWIVLIFWNWHVIGVLVQRGWRSSKRTPPKDRNYTICVKKKKNSYVKRPRWVPTLLLPLYLQASHHLATWSKVDQIGWRHPSLIVDADVWLQDDPMRHSDALHIPNFFLDRPFGFSIHRDTLFCPSLPFRFSTFRVYNFFIYP